MAALTVGPLPALGDDIDALNDGQRLVVEAKGGSSKATTKCYGQPFSGNQVGSPIDVAVVRAHH